MWRKTLFIAAVLLATPRVVDAQVDKPKTESIVDDAEGKPEPPVEDPSQHFNFTGHPLDYRKFDEYGGPYGDSVEKTPSGQVLHEEEPMSPPFVFLLINFGILLVLLGKYGAPMARQLAETRHFQIKEALDEAAKLRDRAAAKLAEYEARIQNVDAEIQALVDGIRAAAEADKVRILAAAEEQAAAMKKDAEQRIAAEIDLARVQLTQEVTAAAVAAAEKILKDKASADDQRKLVATFIADVEAAPRREDRP